MDMTRLERIVKAMDKLEADIMQALADGDKSNLEFYHQKLIVLKGQFEEVRYGM